MEVKSSNPGHTIKLSCGAVYANFQDNGTSNKLGERSVSLTCIDDGCLTQLKAIPLFQ